MFDVTADEIAQLNDTDLRELVGRLCEAELASRGNSPAAVTWGGKQTATDGGLDVRVTLTPDIVIDGFVPRPSTGFQVKTPDMPKAAILAEMRPTGAIRPVIQELANESGAYVIVSSHGSTADTALRNRRSALREGLIGVANADQLHTDFYDRTRLASWVRRHPGLVTWVKERVGRALIGWRPYGPWSGAVESVEAEYLLDDKLRLDLGKRGGTPARPVAEAIDELRDELAQSGKMVRLVGLSGVGKTRFVQALFDARIGSRPLPPSLAIYTNLSDNPAPQPIGLASDLIANRTRAVLIVDNCPSDLHRRLSDLCAASGSPVSVLTVEYDVRDDQPEGTQVVTLDTSSPELIEKLVARRYGHLSKVDARTIAEASGGNARIALAIAGTVDRSETIAGLSDDELFQRLFRQRHEPNNDLLLAAQVCSLLYSFQGEALTGDQAEIPRLALLAGQAPLELCRHIGELLRRELVQRRSVWRAVLPHAIANRLAARALEDIPYELIEQQLVTGGTRRLAQSFSRRLSFLHDHPRAIDIVERWLAPGGALNDLASLNNVGKAMFENIAPVSPNATLAALERACHDGSEGAPSVLWQHRLVLRSLAYDPLLFKRSVILLSLAATQITNERNAKEAADIFASLFTIYLSGTHATIEQRLEVIESLLRSNDKKARSLGLTAFERILEATHFTSNHQFEFGARSRDYGYWPKTNDDVTRWYEVALTRIERLVFTEGLLKPELQSLVAQKFRGLWTKASMVDKLERLFRRIDAETFWREGWVACRHTINFDRDGLSPEALSRLVSLEAELRPSNLLEQVQAVVLGNKFGGFDLEEFDLDRDITTELKRLQTLARDLGAAVAIDEVIFTKLLPDLLRGGNRTWEFGRGLACAADDCRATWAKLVEGLEQLPPDQRNVNVLRGYLAELWQHQRDLAQEFLDAALDQRTLAAFIPLLHSAVQIDSRGMERLKHTLASGSIPVSMYQNLAYGAADQISGSDLKDLVLLIAEQPGGFEIAMEILHMRLHLARSDQREYEPELLETGRVLLRHIKFRRGDLLEDHRLTGIARVCLAGPEGAMAAAEVAGRLRSAAMANETYAFDNDKLLNALLAAQPEAVLDALFGENEREQRAGISLFARPFDDQSNPANEIPCETLIAWCDRDSNLRYRLAATFVKFASRKQNGPQVWSEQARALITHAPNPRNVLEVFIKRFQPISWSGSRAALMEANMRLLDDLDGEIPADLLPFVTESRALLAREIASERHLETERDQARDETFE